MPSPDPRDGRDCGVDHILAAALMFAIAAVCLIAFVLMWSANNV